MGLASQIYITCILVLQLLAMFAVVTRSDRRNERNVNALAMLFVALALFLLWS